MLAINDQNDAVSAHLGGHQPKSGPKLAAADAVVLAAEEACVATNDNDAAISLESDDGFSWLDHWASAWTSATNSMIEASASSIGAMGEIAATAARATAEPERTPEVALWAAPARPAASRSWYRPPAVNLFDPTAWGFPAPLAVYGVPVSPAMMGISPMQAWLPAAPSGMAQMMGWPTMGPMGPSYSSGFGLPFFQAPAFQTPGFANPFVRQPVNPMTAWFSSFSPQPANPWASLTKAMSNSITPNPYASYRSDSGYAVAQIAEPVKPKSSVDEVVAAFWSLLAWPNPKLPH